MALVAALAVGTADATDTSKLSIYQPLTVQDAYPTAEGTVQVASSVRWDVSREGRDVIEERPVVKWGAAPHLQLALAAPYRFGNSASSRSGDVIMGVAYQFTEDGDLLPAMAVSSSVHPFYGALQGTDVVANYLATKSLGVGKDGLEVHLNLSIRHLVGGTADERTDRYRAVFGVSQPIGQDLTVLADFVRQTDRRIGNSSNLFEVGFRRQAGTDSVVSLGVGFGVGDQSLRTRFIVGYQHSFGL